MATPELPRTALQLPLIVIIGATGTGKSQLAVSIAKHLARSLPTTNRNAPRLAAEIVNADAMQLYDGLPIITNKISKAEQEGIPHHLLGGVSLREQTWTINRYLLEADRRIELIRRNGRIPIVVGGTGYYLHGLLLGDSTLRSEQEEGNEGQQNRDGAADTHEEESPTDGAFDSVHLDGSDIDRILQGTNAELLAKLKEVDPEMARRWHPNDRRKIQRSLEIQLKTGKKASEIYDAQKKKRGTTGSSDEDLSSDRLLPYNPLIFWLEADKAILQERLSKRVDAMVRAGLFGEARAMAEFEKNMLEQGIPVQRDRGIWASIGYKEIEPWLKYANDPRTIKDDKELLRLRNSCIEAVKAGTRQYARRQVRYIRIRLANALAEADLSSQFFLLDCSDVSKWDKTVESPATSIVDKFLIGEPLPEPAELSTLANSAFSSIAQDKSSPDRFVRRCEICGTITMTEQESVGHIESRRHKKALESRKRRELLRQHLQSANDEGIL